MFAAKYGKEYVAEASTDGAAADRWMVNARLRSYLTVGETRGRSLGRLCCVA